MSLDKIIDWIKLNPYYASAIAMAIYELIATNLPTKINVSLIDLLKKITQTLLKNRKTGGGAH